MGPQIGAHGSAASASALPSTGPLAADPAEPPIPVVPAPPVRDALLEPQGAPALPSEPPVTPEVGPAAPSVSRTSVPHASANPTIAPAIPIPMIAERTTDDIGAVSISAIQASPSPLLTRRSDAASQ